MVSQSESLHEVRSFDNEVTSPALRSVGGICNGRCTCANSPSFFRHSERVAEPDERRYACRESVKILE